MISKVSSNTNFNGYILKTNTKKLPKKVQTDIPVLRDIMYGKQYNVSVDYNEEKKLLDLIFLKKLSDKVEYIHSVKYDDSKTNLISEYLTAESIYKEKTKSLSEKIISKVKSLFSKADK